MARTTVNDLKIEMAQVKTDIAYLRGDMQEVKTTLKDIQQNINNSFVSKENSHNEHARTRLILEDQHKLLENIRTQMNTHAAVHTNLNTRLESLEKQFGNVKKGLWEFFMKYGLTIISFITILVLYVVEKGLW
jgi:chromosome segregation ATPase